MGDLEKEIKESKSTEVKAENKNNINQKIGNILLLIIIILMLGTGAFTYYLINYANQNYDKSVDLFTNTIEEPDSIANIIDSAISEKTIDSNTELPKIMNEKLIVLYNGFILDVEQMDEIKLKYIEKQSQEKDKYVITYENYGNFSYKDSTLGILSETIYENSLKIENVGKIAISENFNAIPRKIKVINTVPNKILEKDSKLLEYDAVKTIVIDLDGNGVDEYLLVLANKKTGFSKIVLFNSNGLKISDIASIEKSKWSNTTTEYYLSIDNIEIIDVDNDGIMEILVEIPHYEGNPTVSLLKFKNGKLQGKTGIICSLLP